MEESKNKNFKLFDFAGKHKFLTILGCILSAVSSIIGLMPFIYIWKVVESIFRVIPDITKAENLIYYGWMAVAFSIASIIVYFGALMCTHLAAFRIARNMRSAAIHHLVKLPLGYFNQNGSGKLRRIIDESSGQTESFLAHQLPDLTGAYVTPVASLILLFIFDWRLGLISLAPVFIGFLFITRMTGANMREKLIEYQNSLEDMNDEAVEYVRGIPVVKTFQQSVFSFKNFHDAIMSYKKWVVKYTLSLRIPMTSFTVCINSIFAFLIPAGILLIATAINYQEFLLDFIFYVLFTPICTVMMTRILFSSENNMLAQDAVKRIQSILNEKPLRETEEPKKPMDSSVVFENVTFSYGDNELAALDSISLDVPQGKIVALVGPSGGGKTTMASLIPRFWDASIGMVKIGGVDVRDIETKELMKRVSFVFQHNYLFKQSLKENIRAAKPNASDEEISRAARAAQCEEIFEKLPNGIDTIIGSKGVYLSGGEVQRIALARAILKDSDIIVLDEATAFADPENENKIQIALKELIKGKTVIMVAHRLSTVKDADCIVVLNKGKIVEKGTHKELKANKGLYSEMWKDYKASVEWKICREVS